MTIDELVETLRTVLPRVAAHEDRLRDLDAALGDGDLGITVRSGCAAVIAAIDELVPRADAVVAGASDGSAVGSDAGSAAGQHTGPDSAAILRAAGQAFATANPSTFAALVGGGLPSAATALSGGGAAEPASAGTFGRAEALVTARAVADRIAARGKAVVGDKTILDALVPSIELLESAVDGSRASLDSAAVASAMADVAEERVTATAQLSSARGRAAWVGDRSIGHADPGATAYAILLRELATYLAAVQAPTTTDRLPIESTP